MRRRKEKKKSRLRAFARTRAKNMDQSCNFSTSIIESHYKDGFFPLIKMACLPVNEGYIGVS
jgi:hypothetical protein